MQQQVVMTQMKINGHFQPVPMKGAHLHSVPFRISESYKKPAMASVSG